MAATAQAQAEATKAAQRAGIEHAKQHGDRAYLGRKPSFTRAQLVQVRNMLKQEAVPPAHRRRRKRSVLSGPMSCRPLRSGVRMKVGAIRGRRDEAGADHEVTEPFPGFALGGVGGK
jgi:hypothetical protein